MVWLRFTEPKECILRIQWRSWNWKQVHLPASHLSWKASANKKRVCKERDWYFVDSNERDERMQENHVRLWLLHNAEYQIEKKMYLRIKSFRSNWFVHDSTGCKYFDFLADFLLLMQNEMHHYSEQMCYII